MKALIFIYSWIFIVTLTIVFTFLTVLAGIFDSFEKQSRFKAGKLGAGGIWIKQNYCRLVLLILGVRIKKEGPFAEQVKQLSGVVFVANHQSALDIPVFSLVVSAHSVFLAKKELRSIPFFGWAAEVVGTQFIDRSKGARDESINRLDFLVSKKINILLFPEGTRSADRKILPFKKGAFVIAIQNRVPIVPITIYNSGELCPKNALITRRGVIRVHIGEPILTENLKLDDRGALAQRVQGQIAKQLEKYNENRKDEGA